MAIFKEVNTFVKFPKIEKQILKFWEKNKVFEKLRDLREENEKYIFLEGPPTANGLPHVGHVLTRCLKDLYLRYKTMQGYNVSPLIGGWDCHGLPVEIEVEKKLGLDSKPEILEYGVKKFNQQCRQSVMKYVNEWVNMTKRVGFWIDMDNAYVTMEDYYIESVWWSLKQLWEKGLLIEGYKVIPSCPRCEVTLSSHEYSQGLKETEDPSITIKFSTEDEEDTYFLAWTTTPWTLISNVGLAVNPNLDYVKVEVEGEKYYLAKDRLEAIFPDEEYEIVETIKGKELEGKRYEQLFKYVKLPPEEEKKGFRVVTADFVTLEEGTGIVHTAPAFGPEDYELAQEKDLPFVQPVNSNGTFKEEVTPWAGMFIKDADKYIVKDLRKKDLLVTDTREKHTSGFCWRCDTPTMYYARDAWLIKMSSLREEILATNEQINWVPHHLKHGRFGDFLDNIVDWALSRERFWGTPLPIWTCPNDHKICMGSVEELQSYMKEDLPEDFELHQPWIDEIKVYCSECGEELTREPFVIDCWYESGSATFAQWHYPFKHQEEFKEHFPIDFITEAIDQTRGWFYTLLAISTALFNKPAYLNCLTMGHVLDSEGVKMSKHLGNVVQPASVYNTVGADPMRWYFFMFPVWNPTRFSIDIIEDAQRRFFSTLWNIYSFFVTNINIDNIDPRTIKNKVAERSILDQWLISKLNSLIVRVRENLDQFEAHKATAAIDEFVVENLSNWYVRRSRRRFWSNEITKDKKDALKTLYETLVALCKILAPFTPFAAEELYQNLVRGLAKGKQKKEVPLSVHFEPFPEKETTMINPQLEEAMDFSIGVVEAGRAARAKANLKIRLPLQELIVVCSEPYQKMAKQFLSEIKDELNVKEVVFQSELSGIVEYELVPKFNLIGPKFKQHAPVIGNTIKDLEGKKAKQAVQEMQKSHQFTLQTEEGSFEIDEDFVDIISSGKEGYTEGIFDNGQAFISTELTPELVQEGLVRDIIRRIQSMRKEADLEYTQKIKLYYQGDKEVQEAVKKWQDYIKNETLTTEINHGTSKKGIEKTWDIDGTEVTIIMLPLEEKVK
ncbi:MAG: isoleucine--tRNA ligase [Candidatus Heimdallarchaeota archaeon]|nr:isoleucine--tRNA ligase [Candidatus Heimdallarchaeota archaeon]